MKSLILSFFLIFGLGALSNAKPIIDIYSINDQLFIEKTNTSSVASGINEIAFQSEPDSSLLQTERTAVTYNTTTETTRVSGKPSHMTMKTADVPVTDIRQDAEKVFYKKIEQRMSEEYQAETSTQNISEEFESDFYSFKMKIPRSAAALMNSTSKIQ